MPRVHDLLYRFRPAGAPGAPSSAGVPVDRGADLAAELEPVLSLLAEVEQQCQDLVDQAQREAAAVRARDRQRADDRVATARAQTDAERAAVAAGRPEQEQTGHAETMAAAERDAAELRHRAAERIPSSVAEVVATVSGLLEGRTPSLDRAVGAP